MLGRGPRKGPAFLEKRGRTGHCAGGGPVCRGDGRIPPPSSCRRRAGRMAGREGRRQRGPRSLFAYGGPRRPAAALAAVDVRPRDAGTACLRGGGHWDGQPRGTERLTLHILTLSGGPPWSGGCSEAPETRPSRRRSVPCNPPSRAGGCSEAPATRPSRRRSVPCNPPSRAAAASSISSPTDV